MSGTIVPASFRDPAGFVWTEGPNVYRQVNDVYRRDYDHLVASGLYAKLVEDGKLIPHEEISPERALRPGAYKVLQPEVVDFISYPYEWCYSQLRDAALLTIDIQRDAMEHGMSLRDASAFNVQFHHGRPVLIDTLSFEIIHEGRPWIAYRQFCQHFLGPLALMAFRDVRLVSLLRTHLDGVPLDLAARLLPKRTRLTPGLGLHIHAHARSQKRYASAEPSERVAKRQMSLRALTGLAAGLRRTILKLPEPEPDSDWSSYYQEADHYSGNGLAEKKTIVGELLDEVTGDVVWDLGANVGEMARVATAKGKRVICFDVDAQCVELDYRRTRRDGETNLLPLVCDLTNPTPGIGWANSERSSLVERGPADVVLALALIHHLAIGNNVPLAELAAFLAEIGRSLIIEFVPKTDDRVQTLLRFRSDIFTDYSRAGFEEAFREHWSFLRDVKLTGTDRWLYLMQKR